MQLLPCLQMETLSHLGTDLPYYLLSFLKLYKYKVSQPCLFFFFFEKGYKLPLAFFGLEMPTFQRVLNIQNQGGMVTMVRNLHGATGLLGKGAWDSELVFYWKQTLS